MLPRRRSKIRAILKKALIAFEPCLQGDRWAYSKTASFLCLYFPPPDHRNYTRRRGPAVEDTDPKIPTHEFLFSSVPVSRCIDSCTLALNSKIYSDVAVRLFPQVCENYSPDGCLPSEPQPGKHAFYFPRQMAISSESYHRRIQKHHHIFLSGHCSQ